MLQKRQDSERAGGSSNTTIARNPTETERENRSQTQDNNDTADNNGDNGNNGNANIPIPPTKLAKLSIDLDTFSFIFPKLGPVGDLYRQVLYLWIGTMLRRMGMEPLFKHFTNRWSVGLPGATYFFR